MVTFHWANMRGYRFAISPISQNLAQRRAALRMLPLIRNGGEQRVADSVVS